MRSAVVVGAVFLAFTSIGACGSEDGGDGSEAAESTDDTPPVASELSAFESFDDEFIEAVDSLQLGIDLVIEDGVRDCMKEEGFDYVPISRGELARNLGMIDPGGAATDELDYFYQAQSALDSLTGAGVNSSNPNEQIVSSLSPEEQERYAYTQGDCLVEVSRAHPNPLASESNWFGVAVDEAAARTAASVEVVAAEEEFNRCFNAYAFGTIPDINDRIFSQVDVAVQQFRSGERDEEATRATLRAIADEEHEISTAYQACDQPRRQVVDRVYAENFQEIADRDSDKAALWAAEFKELIEPYLSRLEL